MHLLIVSNFFIAGFFVFLFLLLNIFSSVLCLEMYTPWCIHRDKKKKECKSEIYSQLFSPIRQHYHISERFQKATKINYMLKLSYKLLSNHIDNNDENMPRKGTWAITAITLPSIFSFSFFLFSTDWNMRPLISSVVLLIFVAVTQAIGEK